MVRFLLMISMFILVGCGGGSSSNSDFSDSISIMSIDEDTIIKNTLRNANYENISNLVKLSSDVVSFSHIKNGKKYNTVLNTKTGAVLANIENFKATAISSITKDEIKYNNGEKLDIKQYTQSSYQPKKEYKPQQTSSVDPKSIIQNRVKDYDYSVDKFVYTPQKQGAMVLISSPAGWHIYKYGLDNPSNPVREGEIASSDSDDIVLEIKTYSGGKMSYKYRTKTTYSGIKEVYYDYFNMRWLSGSKEHFYNLTTSSDSSSSSNYSSNNYLNSSLRENIQEVLDNRYSSYNRRVVNEIKNTSNNSKVIVSAKSNYGPSIYLFDISNSYNPKIDRVVFEDSDEGSQIVIERVYDNRVQFTFGHTGYRYRKTYNFYNSQEIYSDLIEGDNY